MPLEDNQYLVAYSLLWLKGEVQLEERKLLEIEYPPSQERILIKKDLLNHLSEDAKIVVKMSLEKNMRSRESIRKVLRIDNGWKHDYISLIFSELRTFTQDAL